MSRRFAFSRIRPSEQPLLLPAVALIAGLLIAPSTGWEAGSALGLSVFCWLAAGCLLLQRRPRSINTSVMVTALLLSGWFAAGLALRLPDERRLQLRSLDRSGALPFDETLEMWGRLVPGPELAPDRIYLGLTLERVATLKRTVQVGGRVQLVIPLWDNQSRDDYDQLRLDEGTEVRVLARLKPHLGYRNPGAPDFEELLEHRGYDATGVVKSPLLIERLRDPAGFSLSRLLHRLRARALRIILRRFEQPAAGILAAALLGNRYFLSREVGESFRASGTYHLLVISGLHVAVIAIILFQFTGMLTRWRLARASTVIVFLWAYSAMVGGQPAVTRASVMVTLAVVAKMLFRATSGVNLLSCAAIVLLAWRPLDLFNPGFQLSFLTVAMIVAIASPLSARLAAIGRWRPSNATPYPPRAPRWMRSLAEALYWDERAFCREMAEAHVRYRLRKTRAARALSRARLQGPMRWAAATLLTTTVVQVGLLPVMVDYFHRFSLISPLSNIAASACIFALMIAGGGYLILWPFLGCLGSWSAQIIDRLGAATVSSSDYFLAYPGASVRVPEFGHRSLVLSICFLTITLALIYALDCWNPLRGSDRRGRLKKVAHRSATVTLLAALFAIGGLMLFYPFAPAFERGRLTVTFLDVGQGDAIVVAFPRGRLWLIDGGGELPRREHDGEVFVPDRPGVAEVSIAPFLWHQGIRQLDAIVATHEDSDHTGGFEGIARSFRIKSAMAGETDFEPENHFRRAARASGLSITKIRRGDSLEIDGARVDVLSPFAEEQGRRLSGNDASLVLRVAYGSRAVLLSGDIEREAEQRLIETGLDLRADVLKVAHHGSRTSSRAGFLARVNPRYAVISAARPSPFGHPHEEVVRRLREAGSRVLETGRCGAISVSTDGLDLRVETFVRCE